MLFSVATAVLFWCNLAAAALSPLNAPVRGRSPLIAAKKRFDLTPQVPARFSNLSASFQPFAQRDLFARQEQCVDPGYGQ
jgi:hypothetical protein